MEGPFDISFYNLCKRLQVVNLSEHAVHSLHDCINLLQIGCTNRTKGETKMNATSSRSHAVLTVNVARTSVRDE